MKLKMILGGAIATLVLATGPMTVLAQSGPSQCPNGRGYGGPPATEQERAARQAACLEKNGGVCPRGGPQATCPGGRMGQGKGPGQAGRYGLRDGTGPRSASGTCPLNQPSQPRK